MGSIEVYTWRVAELKCSGIEDQAMVFAAFGPTALLVF